MNTQAAQYLRRHRALFGDQLFLGAAGRPPGLPGDAGGPHPDLTALPQAGTLGEFYQQICHCQNCPLGATRTKFVFGVGNPAADLVFVGEAPGRDEDIQGEPFVGAAGRLLDRILKAIDLTRQEVYILNVIKCRPPQNRTPLANEVAECEPYLKEQLRLLEPKLIVALGLVAAHTLLRVDEPLKKMRVSRYTYQAIEMRVTYHTAALLRNPGLKPRAWEDFQAIRDRYKELTGRPVGNVAQGEARR